MVNGDVITSSDIKIETTMYTRETERQRRILRQKSYLIKVDKVALSYILTYLFEKLVSRAFSQ